MIVGGDSHVQCATRPDLVGLDLSGRDYLKKAREAR